MTCPDSGSVPEGPARFQPGARADRFIVTDKEQARLLSDPRSQSLFRPFLARERTVSQAAEEAGRDLNAVLYRVRQFLAAGLLYVVRQEKRAGRPVKVYRSVHDAYYVPYEVTPFASLEERMLEQQLPALRERVRLQARLLREAGRSGQSLYHDELGEVWFASASDAPARSDWFEAAGASIDYSTEVWLTHDEAMALRAYLFEVLERFGRHPAEGAHPPGPGMKRYHLSVATVALDD